MHEWEPGDHRTKAGDRGSVSWKEDLPESVSSEERPRSTGSGEEKVWEAYALTPRGISLEVGGRPEGRGWVRAGQVLTSEFRDC